MTASGSITIWLHRLTEQADSMATTVIWRQFATRVLGLARSKLRHYPLAIGDEDDVTNAVFVALFTGVVNGDFPNLNSRDDLWALLIRLTQNKAIDLIRFERRKKRSLAGQDTGGSLDRTKDNPVSKLEDTQPTPIEVLQFAEACSALLNRLDDPLLVTIAQLKLEGHTNHSISHLLARPLRTIERKTALIRSIWSQSDAE